MISQFFFKIFSRIFLQDFFPNFFFRIFCQSFLSKFFPEFFFKFFSLTFFKIFSQIFFKIFSRIFFKFFFPNFFSIFFPLNLKLPAVLFAVLQIGHAKSPNLKIAVFVPYFKSPGFTFDLKRQKSLIYFTVL